MSCCAKVLYFIVHCIAHLFFYLIPRAFYYVCCCCCCCVDRNEDNYIYRPDPREILLIYGTQANGGFQAREVVEKVFGLMHTYPHPYEDRQWYLTEEDLLLFENKKATSASSAKDEFDFSAPSHEVCMDNPAENDSPDPQNAPDVTQNTDCATAGGTVAPHRTDEANVSYDAAFLPLYDTDINNIVDHINSKNAKQPKETLAKRKHLGKLRKQMMKQLLRRRDEVLLRYTSPLYNKHLSTILGIFRPDEDLRYTTREDVTSWDGCELMLCWLYAGSCSEGPHCKSRGGPESHEPMSDQPNTGTMDAKGLVILLPGLTSHPQTNYVKHTVAALSRHGYHVCVVTVRGLGDSKKVNTPFLFNGAYTGDIHYLMENYFTRELIAARFTTEGNDSRGAFRFPIIGVGLSIGGAILGKYLGEVGKSGALTPLDAALTVCAPNDFVSVVENMNRHTHYFQRFIYQPDTCGDVGGYFWSQRHQLSKLRNFNSDYVLGKELHLDTDPAPKNRDKINMDRFSRVIHFDRHIIVPSNGYRSLHHYHLDASAINYIMYTPIPLCVISTRDDPVIGPGPLPHRWEEIAENNPNFVYCEFPVGGHLGFLGGPLDEACAGYTKGENFMQRFLIKRLDAISECWKTIMEEAKCSSTVTPTTGGAHGSGIDKDNAGRITRPLMMTPNLYDHIMHQLRQRNRETDSRNVAQPSWAPAYNPPRCVIPEQCVDAVQRGESYPQTNAFYFSSVFTSVGSRNHCDRGPLLDNDKGVSLEIEGNQGAGRATGQTVFTPVTVNCDYCVDPRIFMSGA